MMSRVDGVWRWVSMVLVLASVVAVASWVAPTDAEARTRKGWIYVHRHYNPDDLKTMGAASAAEVYVYKVDGTLINSGKNTGGWAAGEKIELEPGDYLIEVGQERAKANLRKVTVKAGVVAGIDTGWVAVTTWPLSEQPTEGCSRWMATLRAYVNDGGKRHLVGSNQKAGGGQKGRIQLLAGTYEVEWHGLMTTVEVKAHEVTYLATGSVGPFNGEDVRLSAEKSDAAGVPNVTLCADGPSHVLSGDWWVSQTEKLEDYPYERRVWRQVQVPPLDEADSRTLRSDRVTGAGRLVRSVTEPLSADELKAVVNYEEGTLKKVVGGGKFNMDADDF